jgi:hypothetical protein
MKKGSMGTDDGWGGAKGKKPGTKGNNVSTCLRAEALQHAKACLRAEALQHAKACLRAIAGTSACEGMLTFLKLYWSGLIVMAAGLVLVLVDVLVFPAHNYDHSPYRLPCFDRLSNSVTFDDRRTLNHAPALCLSIGGWPVGHRPRESAA